MVLNLVVSRDGLPSGLVEAIGTPYRDVSFCGWLDLMMVVDRLRRAPPEPPG